MPNRDVSAPYIESNHSDPTAPLGGERPADASNSDDSYDEAQRAEIAEVEGSGPTDGVVMTDMDPDMGENLDEDEIEDDADGLTQIIDTNTTPD
jgi:hypothetical protein